MVRNMNYLNLPKTNNDKMSETIRTFKREYSQLSNLVGYAAKNSGLLSNLRFFGNYEPGYDKGERSYSKDASADRMWKVVRILFPSTGGAFTTTSTSDSCFGKIVNDLKLGTRPIVILVELATFLRPIHDAVTANKNAAKEAFKPPNRDRNLALALNAANAELFKAQRDLRDEAMNQFPNFSEYKQLCDHVYEIITGAQGNEASLGYPKYLLEQILVGFVACHYDALGMESYVNGLRDEFFIDVDGGEEPDPDIAKIRAFVVALQAEQYPTPFGAELRAPINNGSAAIYDRTSGQFLKEEFPDCCETGIRHICSLLLWDYSSQRMRPSGNVEIDAFYKQYAPNDGSVSARSAWNKIVGDMNVGEHVAAARGMKVSYQFKSGPNKAEYDLDGFMENYALILMRLFGLETDDLVVKLIKCRDEQKAAKIEQFMAKLFDTISPSSYSCSFVGRWNGVHYGNMSVTIPGLVFIIVGNGHGELQIRGVKDEDEDEEDDDDYIATTSEEEDVAPRVNLWGVWDNPDPNDPNDPRWANEDVIQRQRDREDRNVRAVVGENRLDHIDPNDPRLVAIPRANEPLNNVFRQAEGFGDNYDGDANGHEIPVDDGDDDDTEDLGYVEFAEDLPRTFLVFRHLGISLPPNAFFDHMTMNFNNNIGIAHYVETVEPGMSVPEMQTLKHALRAFNWYDNAMGTDIRMDFALWYLIRQGTYNAFLKGLVKSLSAKTPEDLEILNELGVTCLGPKSFKRMDDRTSIEIPGWITHIGTSVLQRSKTLKSVTLPDLLTSIGSAFLYKCIALSSLVVPDSVTQIGFNFLYNCRSLRRVKLPSALTRIESGAFKECTSLERLDLPDTVTFIGDCFATRCNSIKVFYIPSMVEEVGSSFMHGCTNLREVVLPKSLKTVGSYFLSECSNLRSVLMHDEITNIKNGFLAYCVSIKTIDLPESIVEIGCRFMYGCKAIRTIELPPRLAKIGEFFMEDCTSLETLTFPDPITVIDGSTLGGCTSLRSVTLPRNLEIIGASVLKDCTSLETLTMYGSVRVIGAGFLSKCTSLRSITLSSSLNYIGTYFMQDCTSLEWLQFPNSVRTIKDGVLRGCTSLKSVTLPKSLERIDGEFLSGCESLTHLYLPKSVESIGNNFARNCHRLQCVTFPSRVTSIGYNFLLGCVDLQTLTFPDSVLTIDQSAMYQCVSLKSVKLPRYLKCISRNFMYGCSSLEKLILPEALETIEDEFMTGCTSLKTICVYRRFIERHAKRTHGPDLQERFPRDVHVETIG